MGPYTHGTFGVRLSVPHESRRQWPRLVVCDGLAFAAIAPPEGGFGLDFAVAKGPPKAGRKEGQRP